MTQTASSGTPAAPAHGLTPFALEHAPLLRRLQAGDFASKGALAAELGRDHANLNKTLKRLAEDGLVDGVVLTEAGANAVRALDRLEEQDPAADTAPPAASEVAQGYATLLLSQILPDPLNPRKHFDEDAIHELAASIAVDGLLENLVVRRDPQGTDIIGQDERGFETRTPVYRIVAGERRWRAMNHLTATKVWDWKTATVVCRVLDVDDAAHRRIALVENLQRRDLRPIDEANALKELMAVTGVGTAEVAEQIGFTQRFVQQRLQLLELPEARQIDLNEGRMSIEAARQWLANRPKAMELTEAQWLTLIEVFDATRRRPLEVKSYERPKTLAAAAAEHDPERPVLCGYPAYLLEFDAEGGHRIEDQTGRHRIGLSYHTEQQLQLKFGDDYKNDKRRWRLILAQRQAAGVDKSVASRPEGFYAVEWLNEPFDPSPERIAELDAAKAAAAERDRQWAAQRAAEQKARDEERALQTEALATARDLVANLAQHADAPRQLTDTAAKLYPLPWSWRPGDQYTTGELRDANGQEVELYDDAVSLLVAGAMHQLAGLTKVEILAGDDADADDEEDGSEDDPGEVDAEDGEAAQ